MREETLWRPLNPGAEEPRETQAAFQRGRCNPCPIYVLRRIWDQQQVQKLCHEITLWIGVVVPTSLQTRSRFGLAGAQLTEMTGLMEGKIWPPFRAELLWWCVCGPGCSGQSHGARRMSPKALRVELSKNKGRLEERGPFNSADTPRVD